MKNSKTVISKGGGGKREKEDGERERERIRAWPLSMALCI